MNGILGFAELLREPGLTGSEQAEYIAQIALSSERMLNTINDIVDISKIDSGIARPDTTETDIPALLARAREVFLPSARDKGIGLRVGNLLPGGGGSVLTDPGMLFACLSHLLKNAIKFTERGEVEFGCRHEPAPGQSDPGAAAPQLEFYVRDTGIGVPADRLDAIFERFVQADIADSRAFQGIGLGLSITKAFVTLLGGKIRVESKDGSGSTFFFTIPWKTGRTQQPVPSGDSPAARSLSGMRLKILVVDDDDASVLFLETALREISAEVLCAATGSEAVRICRDNPDLDVVLMDIKMPVMNGYLATSRIREFHHNVVIIAQTAFALAGDREKALDAGADDYLTKPLSRLGLFDCIASNLSKRGRANISPRI
jgi:CheY-like chemotaxis protein